MAKIIGIGNALVDVLVQLTDENVLLRLNLAKGGMTHIDAAGLARLRNEPAWVRAARATGGCASNTVHALSVLGNPTCYIGSIGRDAEGDFFAGKLHQRGIEAMLTRHAGRQTGLATTFITPDGERTFATYLGAATDITAATLSRVVAGDADDVPHIAHVEGYLVQNHDLIEDILRRAKEAGMLVSYDLASWNIVERDLDFVRHLVEDYVDIVFANEDEARAFHGSVDVEDALHELASMTDTAVVKVGADGAWGCSGEEIVHAGARRVGRVIDTTAAGDFFAAGFLHAYIRRRSLEECLATGNAIAGEVVQVLGTQVEPSRLRRAVESLSTMEPPLRLRTL